MAVGSPLRVVDDLVRSTPVAATGQGCCGPSRPMAHSPRCRRPSRRPLAGRRSATSRPCRSGQDPPVRRDRASLPSVVRHHDHRLEGADALISGGARPAGTAEPRPVRRRAGPRRSPDEPASQRMRRHAGRGVQARGCRGRCGAVQDRSPFRARPERAAPVAAGGAASRPPGPRMREGGDEGRAPGEPRPPCGTWGEGGVVDCTGSHLSSARPPRPLSSPSTSGSKDLVEVGRACRALPARRATPRRSGRSQVGVASCEAASLRDVSRRARVGVEHGSSS